MTEYELYHHGVKGQKWGIRRTAAQLGHRVAKAAKTAGKAVGKSASKAGKAAKTAAVTKVKQVHAENKEKRYYEKLHKKKLSQMTDKEIKDLTDRVKREATLKDVEYESRVQNARKFYNNVAKQPINTFFSTYSKAVVEKAFKDSDNNNNNNNDNNDNNSGSSKKSKKNKTSQSPSIDIEVSTEGGPKSQTNSTKSTKSTAVERPQIQITDADIIRYEREQRRDASASTRAKSNAIVEKATGKNQRGTDFDSYFEREVAKQYTRDHGVSPYSTDGMTISEIRRDKEYRKRMGLQERDYKKRVNY